MLVGRMEVEEKREKIIVRSHLINAISNGLARVLDGP